MSANGQIRDLQQQVAELEAELAETTEYRYYIPGHGAGEHAYIAAATLDGLHWHVVDGRYLRTEAWVQIRHQGRPIGEDWRKVGAVNRARMDCWTRQEARDRARRLAGELAVLPEPEPVAPETEECPPAEDTDAAEPDTSPVIHNGFVTLARVHAKALASIAQPGNDEQEDDS